MTDAGAIEHFLHAQVDAWNAGDKAAFLGAYRQAAPNGLEIEYVGKPAADGWPQLEAMWEHQPRIRIEVLKTVINGAEAACHHHNKVIGTDGGTHTIEIYRFEGGRLSARYFVGR